MKKSIIKTNAFENMDVSKIVFLAKYKNPPFHAQDFSNNKDGSVIGWLDDNVLYIASPNGNKIIANENSSFMFFNCRNLTSIQGLQYLDTSNVKDMSYMFSNYVSLTNLDLSSFNTHLVKTMAYMFEGCENLEMVECDFDMRSVKDSGNMFANCPKFFI